MDEDEDLLMDEDDAGEVEEHELTQSVDGSDKGELAMIRDLLCLYCHRQMSQFLKRSQVPKTTLRVHPPMELLLETTSTASASISITSRHSFLATGSWDERDNWSYTTPRNPIINGQADYRKSVHE